MTEATKSGPYKHTGPHHMISRLDVSLGDPAIGCALTEASALNIVSELNRLHALAHPPLPADAVDLTAFEGMPKDENYTVHDPRWFPRMLADLRATRQREAAAKAERDALRALVAGLEAAIQKAIDDDETGKWGPDITVKGDLIAALAPAKQQETTP